MSRIILGLFVVLLGCDIGAGIYEARIVVPLWAGGVPETLRQGDPFGRVAIDAGVRFWAYITSAVALAAIVALVASFWAPAAWRRWQAASAILELATVTSTLFYFRPTLVHLFMKHGAGMTGQEIQARVRRWITFSHVRIAVSLVTWFVALNALRLS